MKFRSQSLFMFLCLFGLFTANAQTFAVSTQPTESTRLTKFTASIKENSTSLNWTTSSEQNSSHFIVERSADGLNFDSIGAVTALGRFDLPTSYNFEDLQPNTGSTRYRIKIIGLDGTEAISKILKSAARKPSMASLSTM